MEYKKFRSAIKGFKGFRDPENLIIDQIISTEERDDGGDVMLQDGMMERGEVVVLYQHGKDPVIGTMPIGRPLAFRREVINGVKCTVARMQYYDGSKLPVPHNLGRLLYDMDEKGFLPNNSIGFTAVDETPDVGGRVVRKWALHEFSKVNIGMNSGCITMHDLDGKVEYKFLGDRPTAPAADPKPGVVETFRARFNELMKKTFEKESTVMTTPAVIAHKIAHKACHLLHNAFVDELKFEAGKCGDTSNFEEIATRCLKDYSEMVFPHASKYIESIKGFDGDDGIKDGIDDEKSLEKCGYKIAHAALKIAHKAFIEEVRACKGKKDLDHVAHAGKLIEEHSGVALSHAKDFVEKYAKFCKEKTFGGLDEKSIAGNIAHSYSQNCLRMIQEGAVSETYRRAWDDRETLADDIAGQVVSEAGALMFPHLKTIIEKVRADNPKDIGEYQKKHFSSPATNPAETVSEKGAEVDLLPGILTEFSAEQKSATVEPEALDFGSLLAELKGALPEIIQSTVTKEIRKAQGKID
jgi:hypothetical protein